MKLASKNTAIGSPIIDLREIEKLANERKSVVWKRGENITHIRPASFFLGWPLRNVIKAKLFHAIDIRTGHLTINPDRFIEPNRDQENQIPPRYNRTHIYWPGETNCRHCRKIFMPKRVDSKYCSKECSRKASQQKSKSQPK